MYKFSKVFQQDADQAVVYDGTTAALVSVALSQASYNCAAYSGKTAANGAGNQFKQQLVASARWPIG